MGYKDFTEMPVWKSAFNLLMKIYKITKDFPSEEKFVLLSDIRRSANIILQKDLEGLRIRIKQDFIKSRGEVVLN